MYLNDVEELATDFIKDLDENCFALLIAASILEIMNLNWSKIIDFWILKFGIGACIYKKSFRHFNKFKYNADIRQFRFCLIKGLIYKYRTKIFKSLSYAYNFSNFAHNINLIILIKLHWSTSGWKIPFLSLPFSLHLGLRNLPPYQWRPKIGTSARFHYNV